MIPLFAVLANDDVPVSVTSFDAAAADPNKNGVPVDGAGAGFVGIENIGLLKLLPNTFAVDAVVDVVAAVIAAVDAAVTGFSVALDALPNWNDGLFSAGLDPKLNVLLAGAPKENF